MSKGIEAFNNIIAEGDFRYFSSLYDRDMFKEDIASVRKELKAFEIIANYIGLNAIIYGMFGCLLTDEQKAFLKEVKKDEHK